MMMSTILLQAAPAAPAPALADWDTLPRIGMTRPNNMTGDVTTTVRRLVRLRRSCRAGVGPMPSPGPAGGARMVGLEVRLIVLVAPDGRFLHILTGPGACGVIRNYARTLFNSYNRGRVRPPAGPGAAWYQSSLRFSWEP